LKTDEYCYIQVFWNVAPCCFINTGAAEIPKFFSIKKLMKETVQIINT